MSRYGIHRRERSAAERELVLTTVPGRHRVKERREAKQEVRPRITRISRMGRNGYRRQRRERSAQSLKSLVWDLESFSRELECNGVDSRQKVSGSAKVKNVVWLDFPRDALALTESR